jgi:hypothetical protein
MGDKTRESGLDPIITSRVIPKKASHVSLEWHREASLTRQAAYHAILKRDIDYVDDPMNKGVSGNTYYAYLQREEGWTAEQIKESLKKSKEYKILTAPPPPPPAIAIPDKPITLDNRVMCEGNTPYIPIGFTMMWAMWGCRHAKEQWKQNLNYMRDQKIFDYVRILTNVRDNPNSSSDYWQGKGIDTEWADYEEILEEVIKTNWEYGFRTEVSILGSCEDFSLMSMQDRRIEHVSRVCNILKGMQNYIQFIEIANESYNIGLHSSADLAQLVRVAKNSEIDVPIAASSPQGGGDADNINELFKFHSCPADITTVHFARLNGDDNYRHCRQPWHVQFWDEKVPRFFSSNEPRNIFEADFSPELVMMDFVNTIICGGGTFVLHCNSGVRGDKNFWDITNMESICQAIYNAKKILPPNLANGFRANHHWKTHPFMDMEDKIWTDDNRDNGCVRCFASRVDGVWWVIPMGIKGKLTYTPRFNMDIEIYDPVRSDKIVTKVPALVKIPRYILDNPSRSYIMKVTAI